MIAVDTNVLVCFLTGDDPDRTARAAVRFVRAPSSSLEVFTAFDARLMKRTGGQVRLSLL